jgi:MoaA/NifB/PqqE/SkfB family radical SAM enzyme
VGVAPIATERLRALEHRAELGRIPLFGTLELTQRCNLRCAHCYLSEGARRGSGAELGTAEVLRLLEEAARAGCLFLLVTGGEPLLRHDFPGIYRRARELGLVVTVFTNATRVDAAVARLLADAPPRLVEVSLYGATPATHDGVTGVPGSHARALEGVATLMRAGVRVGLKTMVLRSNAGEVVELEALAARLGVRFRLDAAVNPRLDGDRRPLAERVEPEISVPIELADPARREGYAARLADGAGGAAESFYGCRAGVTAFHLDPAGVLHPCLIARRVAADARERGFDAAWRAAGEALDRLRVSPARPCHACARRALCDRCVAFFELETGAADVPAPYLCAVADRRARALADHAGRTP